MAIALATLPSVTAERWLPEHVLALAPDAAAAAAARGMATPARWAAAGADDLAVWGLCIGSGAEPYQTVVDRSELAYRCSCPSRKLPCKHALGLLLLWAHGHVPEGTRPAHAAEWLARRTERAAGRAAREADPEPVDEPNPTRPARAGGEQIPRSNGAPDKRAMERAARVAAGLRQLDQWLVDRMRAGLTDPGLARYATWDTVATRLVDAQAPSLANRVKRLAGAVGTRPGWHEHVLAEIGVLHLLARAGGHLNELPDDLAAGVRTAIGWAARTDEIRASPPITDHWHVVGRSDILEDRIVVRRTWLRGDTTRRWAMLLAFAAYGQALESALGVGTVVQADLHFYPGAAALRALTGVVHSAPEPDLSGPPAASVAAACDEVGAALAAEPWLERHPVTVEATPVHHDGRWLLTDHTGSLTVAGSPESLPTLVACAGGRPARISAEWTVAGLVPITVHGPLGAVDIGPREGFR
jgi:hypothetical protein